MDRSTPPLNPLRVFEAASRLGSFTKAATELNITQSAVSRQIAVLENYIGTRLFHRERSGTYLTEAGEKYQKAVGPAFEHIVNATHALRNSTVSQPIRISCHMTFAMKWLLPRMTAFKQLHPQIDVRFENRYASAGYLRDSCDLTISFGEGIWPGTSSKLLVADEIQPVCSPHLAGDKPIERMEDLSQYNLLQSSQRERDWRDWLDHVGCGDLPVHTSNLQSSALAFQAAVEGIGVAMGQIGLLEQELGAGMLVRLFDRPLRRNLGYYAVWPESRPPNRKVRQFLRWMKAESADLRPA